MTRMTAGPSWKPAVDPAKFAYLMRKTGAIPISALPRAYQDQAIAQLHPAGKAQPTLAAANGPGVSGQPQPAAPVKTQRKGQRTKPVSYERILQTHCKAPGAKSEQFVPSERMVTPQRKTLYTGCVSVRITSYRRRLCDPDNLVGKWFLDAARYSCLIADDRPEDISYIIAQKKVATKEEERTEILIIPLD